MPRHVQITSKLACLLRGQGTKQLMAARHVTTDHIAKHQAGLPRGGDKPPTAQAKRNASPAFRINCLLVNKDTPTGTTFH